MIQKTEVRQKIRRQRLLLDKDTISHKAQIALPSFMDILDQYHPKVIGAYSAIDNEFDIDPIIDDCRKRGIIVTYPLMKGKNMPLTFHNSKKLVKGQLGILQPHPDDPQYIPDLIICPFVAVDRDKKRLGFGGGYYDRTISQISKSILVAIGYDFQYCDDFGAETHDMMFDHVILL